MEHDAEVSGIASLGGLSAGTHYPVNSGEPCDNCGAIVPDRFCSTCGQLASDFHRPIWELVTGSLGDLFALDGRLLRSVPMLVFRPGRMTRNYLDGKRARYVPPFRMFLLASVIFFLTVFTLSDGQGWFKDWQFDPVTDSGLALNLSTPEGRATAALSAEPPLPAADDTVAPGDQGIAFAEMLLPDGTIDREALHKLVRERAGATATPVEIETAFRAADQAATVYENQDRFGARLREWAPRFSVLFLPIFSLLLTLIYSWYRRTYVFDHLIVVLHFQTFLYVLGTVCLLLAALVPAATPWLSGGSLFIIFFYVYRMLRVVYRSGRVLTALRSAILLIVGMILLACLALGLVLLSFLLT